MPCFSVSDNFDLFYEDEGKGNPILFVHGWCMSSAIWQLQRAIIAKGVRFISLDLRGHGYSSFPTTAINGFDGYAADIVSLINYLDLQRLVIVGWSMGAQALLRAYPQISSRLSGLILVGATPRFTAAPHFPHALPPASAEGMRAKVRRNLTRALDGFHRNIFADGELSGDLTASVTEILSAIPQPSPEVALDGLETLMNEELMDDLKALGCPTLLIHGACDTVCLPAASEWLQSTIPASRRICYEGVGHAPFLSSPDRFNNDVMNFFRQVSGND